MRLVLPALLALLVFAAPARAAGPELGIADDRILLAGGAEADEAVAEWSALGVQQVRIYALWSRIAGPSRGADKDWAQLDHAVNRVVDAGMEPLLTITGPGPLWTSRRSERGDPRYDPDPEAYAEFAGAVAERYGDRVDRYVVWNEPNLGSWLRPQASCTRSGCTSGRAAPLPRAGPRRLSRHPRRGPGREGPDRRDVLARRPRSTVRTRPTARSPSCARSRCVDASYKPIRSGRCKGFKPAQGDGFAFHPHGVLTAPERAFPNPDDVNLASLPRLERTLDQLQHVGALKATRAALRPLPRRVRLPDQPARQARRHLRRPPRASGCSAPPTRPGAIRA